MKGLTLLAVIKAAAVLAAAIMLGNWFMAELKKARRHKAPWYKPYVSPPGLLMLFLILVLPLVFWLASHR
jgi:hypothetical protein